MRRRWTLAVAMTAALGLLATACAEGEDAAPTTTTSTTTFAVPSTTTTAPPPARSTNLPATGLTDCYDDATTIDCPAEGEAFHLQDGQVQAGGPLSYTDNGDGTVTDDVTGLMWLQDVREMSWDDAANEALAEGTGGYSDWRVPTITELWSLLDLGADPGATGPPSGTDEEPALRFDTDVFTADVPDGSADGRGVEARYVSSTEYAAPDGYDVDGFFGVDFAAGRIRAYPRDGEPTDPVYSVRFVRGPENYGEQDLTGNGDGTLTDEATGLTWLQADSADPAFADAVAGTTPGDGTLDWEEALAFCAALDVAGIADWRLPNAKELQSIVDQDRAAAGAAPVLDPLFATSTPADPASGAGTGAYWTSTSAGPTKAYTVRFGPQPEPVLGRLPGSVGAAPKAGEGAAVHHLVRCVSGGAVSGGAGISPL